MKHAIADLINMYNFNGIRRIFMGIRTRTDKQTDGQRGEETDKANALTVFNLVGLCLNFNNKYILDAVNKIEIKYIENLLTDHK